MAITIAEIQLEWATSTASNEASVGSGGAVTGDEFNPNATAFQLTGVFKADNEGTATDGDTMDVFLLGSVGDPDGSGGDEFTSTDEAQFLVRLDVSATGKNPAISAPIRVDPNIKGGKVYVVNNSVGRAITFSGALQEKKG